MCRYYVFFSIGILTATPKGSSVYDQSLAAGRRNDSHLTKVPGWGWPGSMPFDWPPVTGKDWLN